MKKAKEFLKAIMEANRLRGEISQIINRYPEASFESKVTKEDYNEIIRLESIIGLRKGLNLGTENEEAVLLEIRDIVRDMLVLEGIKNG